MPTSASTYYQLESMILKIDPAAHDCRITIEDTRHLMDVACDNRTIRISEWRVLFDKISAIQARCPVRDKSVIWKPEAGQHIN